MFKNIILLFVAYQYISATYRYSTSRAISGCELGFRHPHVFTSNKVYPSKIACARVCQDDASCRAINVCRVGSDGFRCQPLVTAFDNCGSLIAEGGCQYFRRHGDKGCDNYGTYNETTETCDCPSEEITGDRCEKFFRGCSEAYNAGLRSVEGIRYLMIKPDGYSKPVVVPCSLTGGGKLIVESRYDQCAAMSFNRTWQDFKHGFSTTCENWIGLDLLHAITLQGDYTLKARVVDDTGIILEYFYEQFTIDSEVNEYKLDYGASYSSFTFPSGNGFEFGGGNKSIKGQKFATFDNLDPSGCAVTSGVGWWYGPACPGANLNAAFSNSESPLPLARWPNITGGLRRASQIILQLRRTPQET